MSLHVVLENQVSSASPVREVNPAQGNYLWGPKLDVALLGGVSIIAFLVLQLVEMSAGAMATLAVVMMALANVVNHPHFAHSYQLFYGTWADKDFQNLPKEFKLRWRVVGLWIPIVLVAVLAASVVLYLDGSPVWLAATINLMAALVGWHYVKQGFGMAMVDAAIKKTFWSADARKALLWNAYACWIGAWMIINHGSAGAAFWGVFKIQLNIPTGVLALVAASVVSTTCWAVLMATRSAQSAIKSGKSWKELPLTGLMAYFVSLYLWTIFATVNPAYLFVIPFFHSLQYMTVVYRYKANETSSTGETSSVSRELIRFSLLGAVLGALGFWIMPWVADYYRTGQWRDELTGPALALTSFWVFINVHHYFIDSVLWRQGNPRVSKYLFAHLSKK